MTSEEKSGAATRKLKLLAFFFLVGLGAAAAAMLTVRTLDGVEDSIDQYAVERYAASMESDEGIEVEWDPSIFLGMGIELASIEVIQETEKFIIDPSRTIRIDGVLHNHREDSIVSLVFEVSYVDEDEEVIWTEVWSAIDNVADVRIDAQSIEISTMLTLDSEQAELESVARIGLEVHHIDRGDSPSLDAPSGMDELD